MADRSHRRAYLGLAVLLIGTAWAAPSCGDNCNGGTCVSESDTRELDRVCSSCIDPKAIATGSMFGCTVMGDAACTTGISADTRGVILRGSGGSIVIPLKAISEVHYLAGTFTVEVLAAATGTNEPTMESQLTWGSCGTSCPTDPELLRVGVYPDYSWITVVSNQPTASGGATLPDDATLKLTGSGIEIADIRTTTTYAEGTCSIAGPIGAR